MTIPPKNSPSVHNASAVFKHCLWSSVITSWFVEVVVVRGVKLSGNAERSYANPTIIALVCGLCPKAYVITVSPRESM